MTGKTYQTTLLIRGDSRNAVRQVQLTRGELEKLTGSQRRNIPTSERMGAAFMRANTNVGRLTTGLSGFGSLLATLGIGAFVSKVVQSSDSLASMRGQLALVTESQEELNQVYRRSLALATETGQATSTTVGLYARLARSTEELELGQENLFKITRAVNQSFIVSGSATSEANSAVLQLSQGLAAGALRGEELNSVMENSPRLARALADGLGVGIGRLREMGKAGELTAEAVTGALLKSADSINEEFNQMPITFGRVFQELTNEVNNQLGQVDTTPLQEAVRDAKEVITDPNFATSVATLSSGLINLAGWFGKALIAGKDFATFIGEELARRINGVANDDMVGLQRELDRLEELTTGWRGAISKVNGTLDTWRDRADVVRQKIADLKEAQERANRATSTASDEINKQVVASEKASTAGDRLAASNKKVGASADEAGKKTKKQAEQTDTLVAVLSKVKREADPVAAAIERGAERMDDAFAGFFKRMLREGEISFDSLKNLAIDTLGEIIYAYARQSVIVGVGLGGSRAAGAAATGAASSGGLASSASALAGLGSGAYNLLADGAYALGLDSLGLNARASAGLGLGGQALNLGGGILGGLLGNRVFGSTTGIGSTAGGFIGSAFGPIGAGVGSFLGAGLESLIGNDQPSDRTGTARVDLGTGATSIGGLTGKKFSQENRDAADQIAQQFLAFAQSLGGSTGSLDIGVGSRDGLRLDGRDFGQNIDAFLEAGFEKIIAGATDLDPALQRLIQSFDGSAEEISLYASSLIGLTGSIDADVVDQARQAWEQLNDEQRTGTSAYLDQAAAVRSLAQEFDGSAAAASELNQAYAMNQQMAAALAAAIFEASARVAGLTQDSAQFIRQSVLSEQELRAARKEEKASLVEGLRSLSDPAQIQQAVADIERLNTQIFQSLSPERQAETAEAFATSIETVGRIAARRLEAAEDDLRREQAQTTQNLADILSTAAARQQTAANRLNTAATRFGQFVDQLQQQGIRLEVAAPLAPESNR